MDPECSHNQNQDLNQDSKEEIKDPPTQSSPTPETPKSFSITSILPVSDGEKQILIPGASNLVIRPSYQTSILVQPSSSLQSPMSLIMPCLPPTLFLQAFNKLNESPDNLPGLDKLKIAMEQHLSESGYQEGDITPPDSLTNAPPSYSFVLRQMAARRRPRLMGTFFPSPSFVQHTPPPTYATAFDIYVDNRIPRPAPRVCYFGFSSTIAACPECGYTGMTLAISKITLCTHMSAFILCLFCCWICAPLPYILRSCRDVYHYCRNCRTFLGLYSPTNPENNLNWF